MTKPLLAMLLLLPLPTSDVAAHSGGLDSNGCHAGSQPYHCHRAPSDMVGNRLRCDLGSRSSECENGSDAGSRPPDESTSWRTCVRLVLIPTQLSKWVLRA